MAKDKRLWMAFPIDFHRHPKLQRLPVEARWAFVEMNGEARLADNDGVFAAEDAEFMWSMEVLDTLLRSHPSRPLLVREGETYVIREYAKHQQTRAEREEAAKVSRENGRKGGRPRKNPDETQGVLKKTQTEPSGTQTKAESESESESESELEDLTTYVYESSPDCNAREMTDSIGVGVQMVASQAGITDIGSVVKQIKEQTGRDVEPAHAVAVAKHLLDKARSYPRTPQRYVLSSIAKSAFEVQQYIDERGMST